MVWHSTTKYLGGHSDLTAGVVVANDPALNKRLRQVATNLGLMLAPLDSWLAVRGLKTLRLRMRQHSENALAVARFLATHPAVATVFYPGLGTHPGHDLAEAQLLNGLYGGMLSVRLADDTVAAADAFVQKTKLFPLAPSLAGVASSCSSPKRSARRWASRPAYCV
jgi:cystathionine beta-lyase/cystathionine gamma-synthase